MAMEWVREIGIVLRSTARRPGFAAATILVLALGIGAVSTMFSTLNSVVLRPLPFDRGHDLVCLFSTTPDGSQNSTSALDYFDYRQGFQAFDSVAAYLVFQPTAYLFGAREPEPVSTTEVSWNFFGTLSVRPALGRAFLPADEAADGADVVILGHGLWQRWFGGRASALGRRLELDGRSYEVVGVMPADFGFPAGADAWFPLRRGTPNASGRGNNNYNVFGRLRSGVGIDRARSETAVLAERIAMANPEVKKGWGARLVPMHEVFFGGYRPAMLMLMAAVVLLLLVTCANISSLFLARGISRQGELAVRAALGASQASLSWHVLAESLTLAAIGGGAGLALAWAGIRGVQAYLPAGMPRVSDMGVDGPVTTVTVITCLAAGLLAGLIPAWRGRHVAPIEAMRCESRVTGGGGLVLRSGLVVAQISVSLVLLVGAGLLVKGFVRLQATDVGFNPSNLLLASIRPPQSMAESQEQRVQFFREVLDRVTATPGVKAVALGESMPFQWGGPWNHVWAGERPAPPVNERLGATRCRAAPGYFRGLGIQLVRGREFASTDTIGSPAVVIINQSLASRLWPEGNPVGRVMVLSWNPEVRMEVIGIAADVHEFGPTQHPGPMFYLPVYQFPPLTAHVAVRTPGDPLAVVDLVKRAVTRSDSTVIVSDLQTMESRLAEHTQVPRFRVVLLGVFAMLSLVMAATGLYGLLAYLVAQQSREFGIRLALGARPVALIRMVVGRTAWLAGLGVAIGLGGAMSLAGAMRSLAYQVSPADAPMFVGVSLGLMLVALGAGLVPALRAASLEPSRVLRSE